MSLSSPIPLSRLRGAAPTSDEIHEVDEIFHNLNASVTFEAPDTVSGPRWKQDLHALLEQPTSSPSAFVMHVFITSLIIISALVTVLETVPTFRKISNAVWFGFETTLVALFTIEYIARSLAWSGDWRLFLRWVTCTSCFPHRFSSRKLTWCS
jgi:potassium voltage-gated channel Shal-related subfamily D protein 2